MGSGSIWPEPEVKAVIARQLANEMKKKLTEKHMAELMKTSRARPAGLAVQRGGGYLGYNGRDANVVAMAAGDPSRHWPPKLLSCTTRL